MPSAFFLFAVQKISKYIIVVITKESQGEKMGSGKPIKQRPSIKTVVWLISAQTFKYYIAVSSFCSYEKKPLEISPIIRAMRRGLSHGPTQPTKETKSPTARMGFSFFCGGPEGS